MLSLAHIVMMHKNYAVEGKPFPEMPTMIIRESSTARPVKQQKQTIETNGMESIIQSGHGTNLAKERAEPADINNKTTTTPPSTTQEKTQQAPELTPVTVPTTAKTPQARQNTAAPPIQTTPRSALARPDPENKPESSTSTTTSRNEAAKKNSIHDTPKLSNFNSPNTLTNSPTEPALNGSSTQKQNDDVSREDPIPIQQPAANTNQSEGNEIRAAERQTESRKIENATESASLPEADYDLQETSTEGQEISTAATYFHRQRFLTYAPAAS